MPTASRAFESHHMVHPPPTIKAALRLVAALAVTGMLAVSAMPAAAASNHNFQNRGDTAQSNNDTPFNIDSDPCHRRNGRNGQGGSDGFACGDNSGGGYSGHHSAHQPGSSACGLQFNSEAY
jgi:hypothetical protein